MPWRSSEAVPWLHAITAIIMVSRLLPPGWRASGAAASAPGLVPSLCLVRDVPPEGHAGPWSERCSTEDLEHNMRPRLLFTRFTAVFLRFNASRSALWGEDVNGVLRTNRLSVASKSRGGAVLLTPRSLPQRCDSSAAANEHPRSRESRWSRDCRAGAHGPGA